MRLKTLESKIKYRISRSKDSVFLPADFNDLSARDQVGAVLRKMIKDGDLIKIGYGIYAKALYSKLFNKIVPAKPLPILAKEALQKLGKETFPTKYETLYNEKKSTQVPTGRVIAVKGRISRKIAFDGWEIAYERI